ncbi:histidine kinase [Solwaraspora sp. WMMD1047]|uniref:sensor histidine kinase n=1 Tax=Solwaraspora sp. WMMD1047 TaxID=3016102 RepID=UPI0024166EFF|nr:histidine kinase [Solwaraspora sp. WMMD1047]MDG4832887.1 histidine kinase [Solwaraspora sp. WMMD1047]
MTLRAVLAPLVRASTYRRGVFLLLGGVILLPYVLLGVAFTQLLTTTTSRGVAALLLAVAVVIAATPAFLRGTRSLEIAAARNLLDVDLPEPAASARLDRETRLRSALWIALHIISGGLVVTALFVLVPMATVLIAQLFGIGRRELSAERFGPFDGGDTAYLLLIGLLALAVIGYLVAGLGALAVSMAPVLLGPSQTEREAALQARATRLAERNRLARELHDSVGHALTVATVQAGAAREVLETDPEFTRRALVAIEETSRAAMADLDHVLGLLRERDPAVDPDPPVDDGANRAPLRTLGDLDRLVADTRATGLPVMVEVSGDPTRLPAVVSREGYRIVQEALTNAVRHGARRPVTLRIGVPAGGLEIDLVNPLPAGQHGSGPRSGRGLAGIGERVRLLGGELTAGPDDGRWRVRVRLPTDEEERR